MKKFTILFFTVLTMLSCKNKEENTDPKEVVIEEKSAPTLELGNYLYDDGKNAITFVIMENEKEIKGYLKYKLAEKDENSGKFSGKLKDGILLGKYSFKSEGKESARDIAFKFDGNKLIEGYGELNEDGTTFKDPTNLNFTSKMPLTKTDGVFE